MCWKDDNPEYEAKRKWRKQRVGKLYLSRKGPKPKPRGRKKRAN